MKLEKLASYRTSTAPVDVTVTGDLVAVSDLMKSVCVVQYKEGEDGLPDSLTEVSRHFQTVWGTGVACISEDTFLESDAEGNLVVLHRNVNGVTDDDKRRLEVTSEISLGEMVNRIRPVNIQQLASVTVTPRAFLGTVRPLINYPNGVELTKAGRRLNLPLRPHQPSPSRLPHAPASHPIRLRRLPRQPPLQQIPRLPQHGPRVR